MDFEGAEEVDLAAVAALLEAAVDLAEEAMGAGADTAAPDRAALRHPPVRQVPVRPHGAHLPGSVLLPCSRSITIGRRGSAPVVVRGRRAAEADRTLHNAAARSITKAQATVGRQRAASVEAAMLAALRSPRPADRPSTRSGGVVRRLVPGETPWGDDRALPQPRARPGPAPRRRAAALLRGRAERWPVVRVLPSDRMGPSPGDRARRSGRMVLWRDGPELP